MVFENLTREEKTNLECALVFLEPEIEKRIEDTKKVISTMGKMSCLTDSLKFWEDVLDTVRRNR